MKTPENKRKAQHFICVLYALTEWSNSALSYSWTNWRALQVNLKFLLDGWMDGWQRDGCEKATQGSKKQEVGRKEARHFGGCARTHTHTHAHRPPCFLSPTHPPDPPSPWLRWCRLPWQPSVWTRGHTLTRGRSARAPHVIHADAWRAQTVTLGEFLSVSSS